MPKYNFEALIKQVREYVSQYADVEIRGFLLDKNERSFNNSLNISIDESIGTIARAALGKVEHDLPIPLINGRDVRQDAVVHGFGDFHARLDMAMREFCIHGILDQDLRMSLKENQEVKFLGDAVSMGPYTWETLVLLDMFISTNAYGKVSYLAGNHEIDILRSKDSEHKVRDWMRIDLLKRFLETMIRQKKLLLVDEHGTYDFVHGDFEIGLKVEVLKGMGVVFYKYVEDGKIGTKDIDKKMEINGITPRDVAKFINELFWKYGIECLKEDDDKVVLCGWRAEDVSEDRMKYITRLLLKNYPKFEIKKTVDIPKWLEKEENRRQIIGLPYSRKKPFGPASRHDKRDINSKKRKKVGGHTAVAYTPVVETIPGEMSKGKGYMGRIHNTILGDTNASKGVYSSFVITADEGLYEIYSKCEGLKDRESRGDPGQLKDDFNMITLEVEEIVPPITMTKTDIGDRGKFESGLKGNIIKIKKMLKDIYNNEFISIMVSMFFGILTGIPIGIVSVLNNAFLGIQFIISAWIFRKVYSFIGEGEDWVLEDESVKRDKIGKYLSNSFYGGNKYLKFSKYDVSLEKLLYVGIIPLGIKPIGIKSLPGKWYINMIRIYAPIKCFLRILCSPLDIFISMVEKTLSNSKPIYTKRERQAAAIADRKRLQLKLEKISGRNRWFMEKLYCRNRNGINKIGQKEVITECIFPQDFNEIGKTDKLSYDEKVEMLNKIGIKIDCPYDGGSLHRPILFWRVKLPAGWSIQPTALDTNSVVVDGRGQIRAKIFYQSATSPNEEIANATIIERPEANLQEIKDKVVDPTRSIGDSRLTPGSTNAYRTTTDCRAIDKKELIDKITKSETLSFDEKMKMLFMIIEANSKEKKDKAGDLAKPTDDSRLIPSVANGHGITTDATSVKDMPI